MQGLRLTAAKSLYSNPMGSLCHTGTKKDQPSKWMVGFFGDPYGNRTHVTAVKGRCLNRLTNGPGSGNLTRTDDTPGMNRMLYQLSYAAIFCSLSTSEYKYKGNKVICQQLFSKKFDYFSRRTAAILPCPAGAAFSLRSRPGSHPDRVPEPEPAGSRSGGSPLPRRP